MSNYSGLNILKSKAKDLAKKQGIKLTEALEAVAIDAAFSNYHELSSVAKRFPLEPRLMKAAFGETHFENVIFSSDVYVQFEMAVDELLSDAVASTNANGCAVYDLEPTEVQYDEEKGLLNMTVAFSYEGEQMPDHFFSGTSFFLTANVPLIYRDNNWLIAEEGIEIISSDSNADPDSDWYDLTDS
ncbi:TPA: hypothetical protein MBF27_004785 [Klebsiella pneumoniae]|jgi:hypothetical protein|nr:MULTISPECIES: hypothetical protein [Klebsiella]MCS5818474.1 hypothetical protein [Klebsiella pneumoniae subsp. pneumoniae]ELA0617494.1 hypothetical protein [Klebsiella pneumoniae]ELA2691403.1 hypothetical protein [Klebsiella pneumoniae]MBC5254308.1 hypothetical protein [Klebsiella pneumoniae]MBD7018366.1 hypothetical protein [Klebsiella pneumoniae]